MRIQAQLNSGRRIDYVLQEKINLVLTKNYLKERVWMQIDSNTKNVGYFFRDKLKIGNKNVTIVVTN